MHKRGTGIFMTLSVVEILMAIIIGFTPKFNTAAGNVLCFLY